jgi:hypothetical protein
MLNSIKFNSKQYDSFVHEQAEDRIYRLGQNRDVTVTYHDVSFTIDISMKVLNDIKTTNASIVLADGQTTLNMASSGLSYKEMNGLLGNSVREVKVARIENLIGRSRGMLEAPMIAPPDFCERLLLGGSKTTVDKKGEFISKRPQPAFSSIGDALLHLLGYARNADEAQTKATPSETRPEATRITSTSGLSPDDTSALDGSEDTSGDDTSALNGSEDTSGDEIIKEPAVFKSPVKPTSASASMIFNKLPAKSSLNGSMDTSGDDTSELNCSEDTSGDEILKEPAVFKSPVKPIPASASMISNNFPSKSSREPNALPEKTGSFGNDPLKSRGYTSSMLDFSSDDDSLSSIPGPAFKKY